MATKDKDLDISASFVVKEGIKGKALIDTLKDLCKDDFVKELVRANDEGMWYVVGEGTQHPVKRCMILGDNDYINEDIIVTSVTVKFKADLCAHGSTYMVGSTDFPGSVLKYVREFRDKLQEKTSSLSQN